MDRACVDNIIIYIHDRYSMFIALTSQNVCEMLQYVSNRFASRDTTNEYMCVANARHHTCMTAVPHVLCVFALEYTTSILLHPTDLAHMGSC